MSVALSVVVPGLPLRRWLRLFALGVGVVAPLVLAPAALAQDTVRVRGTIDRVDGDAYLVKARDGAELKLRLAPNASVVALIQAALTDIKAGTYVGVAGLPLPDGSQKALEVHIFPEAMRGLGDGHRGWDLQPSSTMTNGNVEQAQASSDGQVLTLKYKDGEKKIVVPPGIPIVAYVPGEVGELKAGARIFISAAKRSPDGSLEAQRINVGRGVAPPM
ncbi:MAG: hypothetical protein K2X43_12690 [Hyphomonadaceae bacterium]|jgi:hypothetical protein|nr:hypothetical protein [Hyphomonadaceae bacterium]